MQRQSRIRIIVALIMLGLAATSFAANRSDTPQGRAEPQSAAKPASLVYESERGRQLLGAVVREDFTTHLPDWDREYDTFAPDPAAVAVLADRSDPVRIVCVLGTWCGDSEREVPRFWKILDEALNPALEFSMLAVGHASDPEADAEEEEDDEGGEEPAA